MLFAGGSPTLQSYGAAFRILRHYLGKDWTDKNIKLCKNHDAFMLNELDEESENRFILRKRHSHPTYRACAGAGVMSGYER